jgi:lysophospholipid acyltransferase (LPLAT)-like uncharacterized protein
MTLDRRQRFFLLERILLPLIIIPLRLLIRSWRRHTPDTGMIERIRETPRIILVTYHGMLLHLLAFAPLSPRRVVVMVSPSHDGRLLGAFLKYFGVEHVLGSSRSRNIAGSLEFIRHVQEGKIGLIAVDGPRGPRGIAKPGFLKMAAAAEAHLLLATSSANRGVTLKTWDRAHLPAPFATLSLSLELLAPPDPGDPESKLTMIQALLASAARKIAIQVRKDRYDETLRPR